VRYAAVMGIAMAMLVLLAPAAAPTDVLVVDPATSRVRVHLGRSGFAGFLGHDHDIEAPIAEGQVEVVAEEPARSSVRLRFVAARLAIVPGTEPASEVPSVEIRMRGPEVLDAEAHPEIRFESEAVSAEGPSPGPSSTGPIHLLVRGTLNLRGRSAAVAIPVEVRRGPEGLTASGETTLELRALGIEPPSVAGLVKVANRFRLAFEIHASPPN
jgi:polyisoprenoid-binding protein YceI